MIIIVENPKNNSILQGCGQYNKTVVDNNNHIFAYLIYSLKDNVNLELNWAILLMIRYKHLANNLIFRCCKIYKI